VARLGRRYLFFRRKSMRTKMWMGLMMGVGLGMTGCSPGFEGDWEAVYTDCDAAGVTFLDRYEGQLDIEQEGDEVAIVWRVDDLLTIDLYPDDSVVDLDSDNRGFELTIEGDVDVESSEVGTTWTWDIRYDDDDRDRADGTFSLLAEAGSDELAIDCDVELDRS
jgi:hypothetical protein